MTPRETREALFFGMPIPWCKPGLTEAEVRANVAEWNARLDSTRQNLLRLKAEMEAE